MRQKLAIAKSWRALRTGIAFSVFGVGALMLVTLAFPVVRLLSGTGEVRQQRVQWLVHRTFQFFAWFMTVLGLIRVARVGMERLRQSAPCLIVANHPTLIDVVLLIAELPQADCVVKKGLWHNRFLRGVVAAAGYIPNDDGAALVGDCAQRLRAGRRLLLFPEGTRSPRGRLGHFRRGAARIALESGCDVVPVVITCDPPTLAKGGKWYHVPDRPAHVTLEVQEPITMRRYLEPGTSPALAARRLTEDLRILYETKLGQCRPQTSAALTAAASP